MAISKLFALFGSDGDEQRDDKRRLGEEGIDGFLCPRCKGDFSSPIELERHFSTCGFTEQPSLVKQTRRTNETYSRFMGETVLLGHNSMNSIDALQSRYNKHYNSIMTGAAAARREPAEAPGQASHLPQGDARCRRHRHRGARANHVGHHIAYIGHCVYGTNAGHYLQVDVRPRGPFCDRHDERADAYRAAFRL